MSVSSNRASCLLNALILCGTATSAFAAKPNLVLQQPNVSLSLANQLIDATMAACHADGRSAVVAVVDRAGNLIALHCNVTMLLARTILMLRTAKHLLRCLPKHQRDYWLLMHVRMWILIT